MKRKAAVFTPSIKPVTADWPARISLDDWTYYSAAGLLDQDVTLWAVSLGSRIEQPAAWQRLDYAGRIVDDVEIRATNIDETQVIDLSTEQIHGVLFMATLDLPDFRKRLADLISEGKTV